MSKKIAKRSLALGALMAFVITGSAMAAEMHINHEKNGNFHEIETIDVFGGEGLQENAELNRDPISYDTPCDHADCGQYDYNTSATDAPDTYVFKLNDKTLTVNGGIHVKNDFLNITGTKDSALYLAGSLNVSSKIYNDTENSGTVDIGTLNIKNGGLGVNGAPMTVTAKKVYIENSGAGINVQCDEDKKGGNITVITDSLTVKSGSRALRAAYEGGTLNVTAGNVEITSTKASGASYGATLNLTANKGSIDSDFFAGEIDNGIKKGIVNLTLGAGVELTGKIETETTGTDDNASASNITLNGATWKVTGNSNITTLAGDGGKIELAVAPATYSLRSTNTNSGFVTLQIGDASNSNAEITGEGLTEAVENGELSAEDALKKLNESVEVEKGTATLTLEEGKTVGKTTATVSENGITSVTQDVNTRAAKVSKAATNLKAHYRAHMNDMNKRMGELRMANGEAGVWTRMVRGESEYEGAKSQYNQYQLGYDEKLSVDKRWTVGAAVTFAEGNGSYGQGSTEDDSTAFAIYGSKLNNDGTFVDLIARYAHLESDMEDSVYGNGDYSTNGYSISAEFGKRIQQGNGLWIEPQVELTYGTIDSADFRLDGGYNAHFDSMDSFIARAGLSIGKDIKQGNVYARASYLYDFDGETTSLVTTDSGAGTPTPEDFGGGWWEVGVGANINLSKATYIYADVEKTFGGEVDTNWQWNLGVRYSF